jgi:peptidoglycan/LPS O-acetylase OafA/YrhL
LLFVSPLFRLFITLNSHDHWPTYYLTPCRIDLLAAGTLLAIAERKLSLPQFLRASRYGLGLSLFSLLIFLVLSRVDPTFRTGANSILFNTAGYSLVLVMMMGFLAYLIPRGHGFLGRTLSWKPFVYLGVISYGLYMYHELVLERAGHLGFGARLTAGIALVATILVASASWHLIEKPLQRFKTARKVA